MKLSIQKWGNSASIRLPAALLQQLRVEVGSPLDVFITKEGLLLKPEHRPHYKLTDLLAEIPADDLPSFECWDDMPVVGQEAL